MQKWDMLIISLRVPRGAEYSKSSIKCNSFFFFLSDISSTIAESRKIWPTVFRKKKKKILISTCIHTWEHFLVRSLWISPFQRKCSKPTLLSLSRKKVYSIIIWSQRVRNKDVGGIRHQLNLLLLDLRVSIPISFTSTERELMKQTV